MPKLFDIHSHINFNAFKNDGDEVIKKTLEAGVWTILVGSQYDTSKRAVEYAEKYEKGIYAAVGLHPFHLIEQDINISEERIKENKKENEQEIKEKGKKKASSKFCHGKILITDQGWRKPVKSRVEEFDFEKYRALTESSKKVVAIGECGLDYYKSAKNNKILQNLQKQTFEQQIELALKLDLPLIIHCREVYGEVFEILKKFKSRAGNKLRGTIHCFLGTYEEAKKYFELDFSISFTGIITFTNAHNEVIKKSPLEKIMIETDSPYLAPIPYRGKRNEPIYVKEICRRIAEIKNLSFEKIAEATAENSLKMFKIDIQ